MKTLLFVDDEPRVLQGLQRQLRPMRNEWDMHFVVDGKQALNFMATRPVDIIVSDMMMPGMDGPALVLALRQREPQLPILGMTGVGEQADIKGLKGLGLPELLTKPFTSTLLLDTLYQTLAATRQPGSKAGK